MTPIISPSDFTTVLLFSRDDPCNTTIEQNGKIRYTVETRRENKASSTRGELTVTTDIYRGSVQDLVASLRWRDIVSDIVTWRAKGMENEKLSSWLKKSKVPFNHGATFKDNQGQNCKWDPNGPRNQLQLVAGGKILAYFERAQPYVNNTPGFNYNPFPTPSRLLLTGDADAMREAVVLSFLFLEKDRRQRHSETQKVADGHAWGGTGVGA